MTKTAKVFDNFSNVTNLPLTLLTMSLSFTSMNFYSGTFGKAKNFSTCT